MPVQTRTLLASLWLLGVALAAEEPSRNFEHLKPLVEGVRKAKIVTLYEGLPHQAWEAEQLKTEQASKKTVPLHGFPFYEELLVLKDEDAKKLKDLFCAEDSFCAMKPNTHKQCGGFHPDYCIEWKDGEVTYRVQVCFGCHEVRCYAPTVNLYCDFGPKAYESCKHILSTYRKNRPGTQKK